MSDLDAMLSGVTPSADTYPDEPEVKDEPTQAPEPEPEAEPITDPETETEAEPESKSDTESVDEYGNEVSEDAASKMYTQEELNERINQAVRDRLARLERNQGPQQPEQPQPQAQAQQPQTEEDWQKELEKMIDARIEGKTQEQQQKEQQQREVQAQQAFEQKFHSGMSKFKDFHDVVGGKPITDAMVHATRGMKDPASFFYAAAKKAPDDLDRISKIGDPYAQIAEMGRLDAKLRAQKPATKAPRPLNRTSEDVSKNYAHTSRKSVDDLINESNQKRMDNLNNLYGGGRRR